MDYTDFFNTAKELLSEFGRPITLKKMVGSYYDEEEMKEVKVYEYHEGIGAKFNYESEAIGASSNVIKAGDVKIICQFPEVPTEDKDQIEFGNNFYNVVNVSDISPDSSMAIIYKVQCRRVS